jgi:hypothetical protein
MALRLLLLALALLAAKQAAAQPEEEEISLRSSQVSCTSGPYRIKLPKTYSALRRMAVLKREKSLGEEHARGETVTARELRFVGLEMVVYTSSGKPNQFQLARATFTTPKWRIMGPLRVGAPASLALQGLRPRDLPRFGEVTLEGEHDSILLTVAGGRVQEIDYECATD